MNALLARTTCLVVVLSLVACTGSLDTLGPDEDALSAPVTTRFQNGVAPSSNYTGTTDTSLLESTPTTADGADATVRADADYPSGSGKHASGLLRFDLSSIPVGSTVSAVTLTLNVTNSTTGLGFTLYPALRPWTEAGATWSRATSSTAWAAAGARSTTDRGVALAVVPANHPVGKLQLPLNAAGVRAVQAWVANPSSNDGFILDSERDPDGFAFDSAQASTPANRPELSLTYVSPAVTGNGTGLTGQYFRGTALAGSPLLTRTDATVDFNWGSGAPASAVPADGFSVRWSGEVEAQVSQTYTFTTNSDDGVRLWVNGQELINNWTLHSATSNSGSIALSAGQKYSLKMEYYENTGSAVAQLFWASPSTAKQIIPRSQLFPSATGTPPADGGTGTPPPNGGLASDLDDSGHTIPDTNYPIPQGAIFMSPSGDDRNAGTSASPVKTLNRAVALVPNPGTIVVHGGVYRDAYVDSKGNSAIVTKSITLQAFPHEQPWFDGTQDVASSSWTSDGQGHWYVPWSTPQFCQGQYYLRPYDHQDTSAANSGPCAHWDNYSADYPAAGDPQMLFVDGARITEVGTLAQVTPTTFFYDWSARRMYMGENPAGHVTELAVHPGALILGSSGNQTVRGVGFRRYATNEFSNTTNGAVYLSGTNSLVENCVFTQMAAKGVSFSGPINGKIIHSVFAYNGENGAGGNGHGSGGNGTRDGFTIQDSVFNYSNLEHFDTHCSLSCGSAHIKLGHMVGWTVKNNIFRHNSSNASGIWCDTACYDGFVLSNLVDGSSGGGSSGIFCELNNGCTIASNVVIGYSYGINVTASNVRIYNNTVVSSPTIAIRLFDDSRPDLASNMNVQNNLTYGTNVNTLYMVKNTGAQVGPQEFMSSLDYNAWFRSSSFVLYRWIESADTHFNSTADFRAVHGQFEAHSLDMVGADPFVAAGSGDYRVSSGSPAYHSGTAIPQDIATALGVSSTGQSRGALQWPGMK